MCDAILQADLLELDGVEYRPLLWFTTPPAGRQPKDRLARLLTRVQGGIALNEHTDARGELVLACLRDGTGRHCVEAAYRKGRQASLTSD